MSSVYDDGDSTRKSRERFIADVALRDPLPHDRPTKFFIDVLFTAINTGLLKDIQRAKAWVIDYILPSSERTRLFTTLLVTLSRSFQQGHLPTAANRTDRVRAQQNAKNVNLFASKAVGPTAQRKRLHILSIICDILASLHPSNLELPKRKLPGIDFSPPIHEIKHSLTALTQLAACSVSELPRESRTKNIGAVIADTYIGNWIKRGIYTAEEGQQLRSEVIACVEKDVVIVAQELHLDEQNSDALEDDSADIKIDRTLPTHHGLPDQPNAPWDALPAMNGFFLKRIRGFPIRAGGLQNGLMLQNAGQQSSEETKADIIATYKTGKYLTRRFTAASSIADVDELGNIVPTSDSGIRPLNYAALPINDLPKIQQLQETFSRQALGYDGIAPLARRPKFAGSGGPHHAGMRGGLGGGRGAGRGGGGPPRSIDSDVERAVALARGGSDVGRGGGGMRGGYGDGGRGNIGGSSNYRGRGGGEYGSRGDGGYGRGGFGGGAGGDNRYGNRY